MTSTIAILPFPPAVLLSSEAAADPTKFWACLVVVSRDGARSPLDTVKSAPVALGGTGAPRKVEVSP